MLNYEQLKLNLICYRLCYKLCLLPLKLDHPRFYATNGRRYFVWKLQYLLSSVYGIFMAIRLLQLLLVDREEINLIYFSVHAAMSLMGTTTCMFYKMLISHKGNHILLCNELLLHVKQAADERNGWYRLGKDLLCLWRFSVPEILLLLFPIVMMAAPTVIVPVLYFFQHESPQFLYSLCPIEYKSVKIAVLFAVPEWWLICSWFSTCYHFGFLTAALLQKSIDICNKQRTTIRVGATLVARPVLRHNREFLLQIRMYNSMVSGIIYITELLFMTICNAETTRSRFGTTVTSGKVLRQYREFLLLTKLYNYMASGIIYMTKLLFMTMAILGFFITIRYGADLPVLITAVNLVMGVLGAFLYNFLYDAAVWMPIKFQDLKQCLYSGLTQAGRQDRANVRKELMSLPAVALRIGSFHTFARTTTPEFVGFVVQQICSLLLTFR